MIYRPFRALAKLALSLFFREIEVEGRGHVPTAGELVARLAREYDVALAELRAEEGIASL